MRLLILVVLAACTGQKAKLLAPCDKDSDCIAGAVCIQNQCQRPCSFTDTCDNSMQITQNGATGPTGPAPLQATLTLTVDRSQYALWETAHLTVTTNVPADTIEWSAVQAPSGAVVPTGPTYRMAQAGTYQIRGVIPDSSGVLGTSASVTFDVVSDQVVEVAMSISPAMSTVTHGVFVVNTDLSTMLIAAAPTTYAMLKGGRFSKNGVTYHPDYVSGEYRLRQSQWGSGPSGSTLVSMPTTTDNTHADCYGGFGTTGNTCYHPILSPTYSHDGSVVGFRAGTIDDNDHPAAYTQWVNYIGWELHDTIFPYHNDIRTLNLLSPQTTGPAWAAIGYNQGADIIKNIGFNPSGTKAIMFHMYNDNDAQPDQLTGVLEEMDNLNEFPTGYNGTDPTQPAVTSATGELGIEYDQINILADDRVVAVREAFPRGISLTAEPMQSLVILSRTSANPPYDPNARTVAVVGTRISTYAPILSDKDLVYGPSGTKQYCSAQKGGGKLGVSMTSGMRYVLSPDATKVFVVFNEGLFSDCTAFVDPTPGQPASALPTATVYAHTAVIYDLTNGMSTPVPLDGIADETKTVIAEPHWLANGRQVTFVVHDYTAAHKATVYIGDGDGIHALIRSGDTVAGHLATDVEDY